MVSTSLNAFLCTVGLICLSLALSGCILTGELWRSSIQDVEAGNKKANTLKNVHVYGAGKQLCFSYADKSGPSIHDKSVLFYLSDSFDLDAFTAIFGPVADLNIDEVAVYILHWDAKNKDSRGNFFVDIDVKLPIDAVEFVKNDNRKYSLLEIKHEQLSSIARGYYFDRNDLASATLLKAFGDRIAANKQSLGYKPVAWIDKEDKYIDTGRLNNILKTKPEELRDYFRVYKINEDEYMKLSYSRLYPFMHKSNKIGPVLNYQAYHLDMNATFMFGVSPGVMLKSAIRQGTVEEIDSNACDDSRWSLLSRTDYPRKIYFTEMREERKYDFPLVGRIVLTPFAVIFDLIGLPLEILLLNAPQ